MRAQVVKFFVWLSVFGVGAEAVGQDLRPYAETCPTFAKARYEARRGRGEVAVNLIRGLLKGDVACQEIPREALGLELGRIFEAQGRWSLALGAYQELERGVLSDEALFRQGQMLLRLGRVEEARAALGRIGPSSARFVEARIALAGALMSEGRGSMAISALKGLLGLDLAPGGLAKARLALARALIKVGDVEGALDQMLDVYLFSSASDEAALAMKRVGRPIGEVERVLRTLLRGDEHEVKNVARTLMKRNRNGSSVLKKIALGVMLLKVQRDAARAVEVLRGACEVSETDLAPYCLWFLGQALVRKDEDLEAISVYRTMRVKFAGRLIGARAAIAEVKALIRLRRLEEAKSVLEEVGDLDPGHRREVLWLRALIAMMGQDRQGQIEALDALLTFSSVSDGVLFGAAERAMYFRAVALRELGAKEAAENVMKRVARGYPHSYYGVLASTRLREWGIAWEPQEAKGPSERSRGPEILWRLGEQRLAVEEMKARAHYGVLREADLRVLALMLASRAKVEHTANIQRFLRGMPAKEERWLFELAYPRPFKEIVEEAALESGVDEALIYAVARAESGFNPRAMSPRGAVGLMQLMRGTAKVVSNRIFKSDTLAKGYWNPRTNVRLGSALLAALSRHFRGHLPLILAGYNAGAGAARRFHRRLADLPTDVFVEAMPYGQTQAYLKKVVGLAAGYASLYGNGRVFEISLEVPKVLGPFLEPEREGPRASLFNYVSWNPPSLEGLLPGF